MEQPIINSKLEIPAIKEEYIRRAALTKKLKKIPECPLTIIHSGAGYGKSTATALFMRDEKISGCWYSLSSMDDDILPFLTYLTHAVRRIFPGFGKELFSYIERMDMYIRDEEITLLCSLFINEILAVHSDVIIILDDFHQVEHSYTINGWMEKLLEHIPANLHLVISSRSKPVWRQLLKMKVSGRLLEITREDLVLTVDEMELLLSDLYGLTIDSHQLKVICQMTEGWIIALCLIAQQIPLNKDIFGLSEHTSHSLHDFFQYLAMEVFSKQPPMIQQFLEQTSIFEEIDEEMCNSVMGISSASSMLEQLMDKNLFLQKVGLRGYRYHALFKEFLENQLRKNQPNLFTILHERCARLFEKKQMWESALYHYKKIKYDKAIASILQTYGPNLVESGKLESLFDYIHILPKTVMRTYYHLWYLKAEVYRYRSCYLEAEECYQTACNFAKENQDFLGLSKALEGKARIYLDTIQPQMAETFLYEAIANREKSPEKSDEEMSKLYQLLSENLLNLGKSSKAEDWLKKAKSLNQHQVDRNLEARLYLRTGRFTEARKILQAQKLDQKEHSLNSLPQSHRETELLLSLMEGFTGEGMRAKELAQAGIQQGVTLKAPMVEACGWIRMGHAVQLLNKYDLDLAKKCYETALEIMDQMGINRGKAEPLMGLCILYGTKGEYERAIEAGNNALQETEKVCDVWLSGYITLCMGITCIYFEQFPQALEFLEKTEESFQRCEDTFGQMLSKLWQSYLFHMERKFDLFKSTASLFLKMVQGYQYEFLFFKRSVFGPRDLQSFIPLLIDCVRNDIGQPYAGKILQDMGVASFETHPGYSIRVKTLGQFKIWLGEREVNEKTWQREKARELFQLLITQSKPISKDEIMQILWPNQDKQSADRDFKVALNALHHVLEPKRKARAAPFFVVRDGMFYGLNPLAAIELDSNMFQELTQIGLVETQHEKAIDVLEKGLALYNGEYLPERRYDDWCISKRESMLVYFLRGAEKMAQLNIRIEHYDQAIYWCENILNRDRTWEEAYRLIMYCYYRKNNRSQAIKWYQRCVGVLEEELSVSPLEPTRHMFEMILQTENLSNTIGQP